MKKISKLRKLMYILIAVGGVYFILTFAASFTQYLSNK